LEQSADGGTTVTGAVGIPAEVREVVVLIAGAWGVILLAMLAGGAALLASGRIGGLAAVLGSLALVAVMAVFRAAGLRSLQRNLPRLVAEMNETLGSTAVFPSPDAGPANGNGA
jgi:hypothetical protein